MTTLPSHELSRRAMLLLARIDARIAAFETHPTGTAEEFDATLRQMRRDREAIEAEYEREKQTQSKGA